MFRWFIAFRYLFRLITLAALLAVTYSVAVLIIVVSVMEGFRMELEQRIRGATSDIRVESEIFIGLENYEEVERLVGDIPGVAATAPVVESLALFRGPWSRNVSDERAVVGLDLSNPESVNELDSYIREALSSETAGSSDIARLLDRVPASTAAIFSKEWLEGPLRRLAALYSAEVRGTPPDENTIPAIVGLEHIRPPQVLLPGMTFELTSFSPVPPHAPKSRKFVVAGYFKTGLYELDAQGIILRLEDADRFLDLRGEDGNLRVSAVRVTADEAHADEADLVALRERIEAKLADAGFLFLDVQTWREARASLLQAVSMEKFIVSIILGVVILFAGFMIFIILTVQAVERSRDIGVLVSLGATPRHIGSIYFLIGIALCLGGTVLGAIYGVGFAVWINPIQRWIKILTGFEVFSQDVYYLDRIPVRFNPQDLVFIIIPTVAASLIASLIPAIRAARRDPLVSLRTR